jgi:uncharacterized membrane protein YkoI
MFSKLAHGALIAASSITLMLPALTARAEGDIGFCRAEQIATEKVKGIVKEMARSAKKGKAVFKVEVRTPEGASFDVLIDAVDGTVLSVKQDD